MLINFCFGLVFLYYRVSVKKSQKDKGKITFPPIIVESEPVGAVRLWAVYMQNVLKLMKTTVTMNIHWLSYWAQIFN